MPINTVETKTETLTKTSLSVKINLIMGMVSALFLGAALVNASFINPPRLTAQDIISPYVAIVSPVSHAVVNGDVIFQASTYDASGIKKVEFYINGSLAQADENSQDGWLMNWQTTTYPNGPYQLVAKSFDQYDNSQASQAIFVTVNN